jgi:hypothetical protein
VTVYPSVDAADFWADFKRPLPEIDPVYDRPVIEARVLNEQLDKLPLLDRQCFELLDDLQRIAHLGCELTPEDIGLIRAKLIFLRINLNIPHGVNTPQLD